MKVDIEEYEGCFSIDFTPETVEDAVMLVRLKTNGIKEVRSIYVHAHKDLSMSGSVVIGKRKQPDSRLR